MSENIIPPEAIEGLMKKVFVDQSVDPGLFWDALLNSRLVVPIAPPEGAPAERRVSAEGLEEFPMLLGVDDKGDNVVWIFTSAATMVEYTGQSLHYVELPSATLFTNLRESENDVVLIGPGGVVLSLNPELIDTLADGKAPERSDEDIRYIAKEAKIYAGPPSAESAAFEEPFRKLFDSRPDVLEAIFLEIRDENGPRLLLGLRLKEETREILKEMAFLVSKAAEGILERGKTMDITLIDGSLREAFNKYGKSFFKR